ncbi:hypothetical protein JVU11DRAFT_9848 [Chiua virens]|nr:hypothetical protein JVU11DRAFT_9848 [Chiua virens]
MSKKISEMTPAQRTRSRALAKERQRRRRANLTGAELDAYKAHSNEYQRRYKQRKKGTSDNSRSESRPDPSSRLLEDEVSAAEGGRQVFGTRPLQVDSAEDGQLGPPVRTRRRRRPNVEESHEDAEPSALRRKRTRRQVESGDRIAAGPPRTRRHLVPPNRCSTPSAIPLLRDLSPDSSEAVDDDQEPGSPPRRALQPRPSAPTSAAFVVECLILCFFMIMCLLVTWRFDWSGNGHDGEVDASNEKTPAESGSDVEMGAPTRN